MKTKIIIAGFITCAGVLNAQWTSSGNDAYKNPTIGNVGIGTTSPTDKLYVETNTGNSGLTINQTNYNASVINLKNSSINGHDWWLASTGAGNTQGSGHFDIYDFGAGGTGSGASRLFIHGTTGNVGMGIQSPANKLSLSTSVADDGIRISQTGTGSGVLYFDNASAGGNIWSLRATGSADVGGAGNMSFYNNNLGAAQMFFKSNGNVGIGNTSPTAKLHVDASGTSVAAVAGNVSGVSNTGNVVGVRGSANSGLTNYGGYFTGTSGPTGVKTYGVRALVFNNTSTGTNYAIYASVENQGIAISNSGSGPNYAGYFDGDVFTTSANYYTSDRRLKKNIVKIDNSLSIINKLNPVNYNFDLQNNPNIALPAEKQYGFISQEIQETLPEFTKTIIHPAKFDESGKEIYPEKEILGLNYQGFIALLTKGVQEQQTQIESLSATVNAQQKQLAEQKEMINALINKTGSTTGVNEINTTPAGFDMGQNIPNPFSNETVIKYTVPATVANASMMVYDLSGKQVAAFPLTEKGSSSITITSEKLAAGIYIYSIMADGKIIDSKRMVVATK